MNLFFRSIAFSIVFVVSGALAAVDPELFEKGEGDEVIDSGEMQVSRNGTLISREQFEVARRADGGRTIVSRVKAANGSFDVQGRWDYDAEEEALSAQGWGRHGEESFDVTLVPGAPKATMTVSYQSGEERIYDGACGAGCLLDMMPGALPQFTMTRRYDYEQGGIQDFRWMAFVLNVDMRSFDVEIDFVHTQDIEVSRADGSTMTIRHFVFDERGSLDGVGEGYELHSNLWVDEDHRPIKFRAGQTIGLRTGFEDINDQLVAQ